MVVALTVSSNMPRPTRRKRKQQLGFEVQNSGSGSCVEPNHRILSILRTLGSTHRTGTQRGTHPLGGVEPGRAAWQASARSPLVEGLAIGRHRPAARPPTMLAETG